MSRPQTRLPSQVSELGREVPETPDRKTSGDCRAAPRSSQRPRTDLLTDGLARSELQGQGSSPKGARDTRGGTGLSLQGQRGRGRSLPVGGARRSHCFLVSPPPSCVLTLTLTLTSLSEFPSTWLTLLVGPAPPNFQAHPRRFQWLFHINHLTHAADFPKFPRRLTNPRKAAAAFSVSHISG